LLAGCAKDEVKDAKVTVSIPPSHNSNSEFLSAPGVNALSTFVAPATVDGLKCYFLNVMGPDIPSSEAGETNSYTTASTGDVCGTYLGVNSGSVNSADGGNFSVTVPTGASRIFQIFGFNTTLSCDPNTTMAEQFPKNGDNFITEAYEIGRKTADIYGDTSLSVDNSFNPATTKNVETCDWGSSQTCTLLTTPVQTSEPSSITVGTYNSNPYQQIAQRLDGDALGFLFKKVTLKIGQNAISPATSVTAYIYGGSSLSPSTAIAGASSTVLLNSFTASEVDFMFGSTYFVGPAVYYWLVLVPSGGNIAVVGDVTGTQYTGDASYYTGAVWTALTFDFYFKLFSCS